VYDRLAQVLVAASPVPLTGRRVLDVGAGTGAAARAIVIAGGRPVAVDLSLGMLRADPTSAGRAVVGDARRLAVRTAAVDGLVAAFSFNHLHDPAAGFREARRVCGPGSPVLVAAYAADDHHPVKAAAEQALVEAGWTPEPWYDDLRVHALPRLATVDGMRAAARSGGLDGRTEQLVVPFPELSPADLVTWRLGMAPTAPFLAGLAPAARTDVRTRALDLLGPTPPPLHRTIVVFAGSVP
jgi:SAM-dependent methyltransferase